MSEPDPAVGTTPLRQRHDALGARFIPFSGYEMPLQFDSILQEHEAVRSSVGVFDVSHMSNLDVPLEAAEALSRAVGANVPELAEGVAKYTVCLRDDGRLLDDVIVFHLPDRFHVVPNAGMNEAVGRALSAVGCPFEDRTQELCILAVQGADAPGLVEDVLGSAYVPDRFRCKPLPDGTGFVSGTGYTGEPGLELVAPASVAGPAWDALMKAGVQPCGLGARDTLRLEMGYCLAGNEFEPPVTPVEANLLWTVDLDHDFTGRDAVVARKEAGPETRLTGLRITERGVPRRDCKVLHDGQVVGRVSSGTMSPTLGTGIALAYVHPDHRAEGTELQVQVRRSELGAVVEAPPFVDT